MSCALGFDFEEGTREEVTNKYINELKEAGYTDEMIETLKTFKVTPCDGSRVFDERCKQCGRK